MDFETLFTEWTASREFAAFVRDGIIDPGNYERPHILFVLRDMNCHEEKDLCECLRTDGSGWKTWNNICRWTKALLEGIEEYPWDMSEPKRVEQLRRIAVMNLKKEGGGNRTDGGELSAAVEADKKLILREINLCDPDIIICCGLSSPGIKGNAVFLQELFPESTPWESFHSENLDRDWWFYMAAINGKQVPVVSYCHPQVTNLQGRRGHQDLFIPLYRDMLEIRKRFLSAREEEKR